MAVLNGISRDPSEFSTSFLVVKVCFQLVSIRSGTIKVKKIRGQDGLHHGDFSPFFVRLCQAGLE